MNEMYRQVMQDTLEQIEDLSKRLSRPIKDLDDIRVTMAAQKELRENEITIDLSLGPVEVRMYAQNCVSAVDSCAGGCAVCVCVGVGVGVVCVHPTSSDLHYCPCVGCRNPMPSYTSSRSTLPKRKWRGWTR